MGLCNKVWLRDSQIKEEKVEVEKKIRIKQKLKMAQLHVLATYRIRLAVQIVAPCQTKAS